MGKRVVRAESVVEGMGPYSQCIQAGGFLFVAGQVAWDREGKVVGPGDVAVQARQCFDTWSSVEAAGASMDDVVKVNFFLTDISHVGKVRAPARSIFALPYPATWSKCPSW
ncbi:MAG: Rid family hydrolase [Dehalococcoidia bacterium]